MLLLVLAALSLVWSTVAGDRPQPCCVPYTHSIVIMSYTGSLPIGTSTPSISDTLIEISADYHNMIEGVIVHRLDPATNRRDNTTVISLYNNRTQYIVTSDGNCYKQHIEYEWMQPRCIPDNYTYDGSFRVGGSSNGFMVHSWTGPWLQEMTTVLVTADGECTLVAESYYGITADGSSQNVRAYLYTDFQKGVVYKERFTPPSACDNSRLVSGVSWCNGKQTGSYKSYLPSKQWWKFNLVYPFTLKGLGVLNM